MRNLSLYLEGIRERLACVIDFEETISIESNLYIKGMMIKRKASNLSDGAIILG